VGPPYPRILPELEAAERLLVNAGATPGAVELARNLVTFPTHPRVQPRDLEAMQTVVYRVATDRS
jgi:hypothetical protein